VAEYEALVNQVMGDFKLIVNEVMGESNCRDSCMVVYR
jgi:hypothetical protein